MAGTATSSSSGTGGRRVEHAGLVGDERGTADDRPSLILLHGLSFDRAMWGPVIDALSTIDPDRHVIAFDLPGHGESSPSDSYSLIDVVEAVFHAVAAADVVRPVVVGHSIAAMIATVYATRHPVRGVVNVDQSLEVSRFATLLASLGDQLRSAAFPDMWQHFLASMHIELLPADAQELLRPGRTPRQDVVLGYWSDILDHPPEHVLEQSSAALADLRSSGVPYLILSSEEPDAPYREWLAAQLPQAEVVALVGGGHFPHLAHPAAVAQNLARTSRWA